MNPFAIFSVLRASWVWIVIGVLAAALGVQTLRLDHAETALAGAKAEFANERATAAQVAQAAEAAARAEEARRTEATRKVVSDAQAQTVAAQSAAHDAATAADSLRQRVAALVASSRAPGNSTAAGRGSGQQGDDPIGMLAELLNRVDERQGIVAAYADRLRIAGQSCEAAYDSLTR